MECLKCQAEGSIFLRKKDFYCNNCLILNVNHKFRASIGKRKILKTHEKVLIALSSSMSSLVMLDMISNSINLETHKKLRISAVCLHVIGDITDNLTIEEQIKVAERIIQQCHAYEIKVYVVHLSFKKEDLASLEPFCLPSIDDDKVKELSKLLSGMTPTAMNDCVLKLKRKCFLEVAKQFGCKFIFTAETSVKLATNMLSSIVVGRGSQVEHDVGFCDTRNAITILRPMKDISLEEITYYASIKSLNSVKANIVGHSLQSVIGSFVVDLQENYQATISTICKTADKVGGQNEIIENPLRCRVCESLLENKDNKLTALQATNFSRAISSVDCSVQHNSKLIENVNDFKRNLVPFEDVTLCYGCSRTYSEVKDCVNTFNKLFK